MKYKAGIIWVILFFGAGILFWSFKNKGVIDQREVWVNSQGVQLKSVSPKRQMTNVLDIDGEVKLWIPGGLGWYEANKIEKLLRQEKKLNLIPDILFYNFGYDVDKVVLGQESRPGQGMIKKERLVSQLPMAKELLSVIMPRDFADSQVVEEGIRISVYNLGNADGLANFVARSLEWMGLTVIGVENLNRDMKIEKCLVLYGENTVNTMTGKNLNKKFAGCQFENSDQVNRGEVELYLNDKYAEMINYESYSE